MNPDDIFHQISSKNHWRVRIRPSVFEERRISSLGECRDIVDKSQLRLRGWYYPHIQHDYIVPGGDWVQSGHPAEGSHLEAWRLYQSGQFVHCFLMDEDFHELGWRSSAFPNGRPERYLEFVSTLYRLTEIYEFAARLASRGVLSPAAELTISWSGLKGRVLVPWTVDRYLPPDFICQCDKLDYPDKASESDFLTRSTELALDAAIYIFERFGWYNPSREILSMDQRRLLERL